MHAIVRAIDRFAAISDWMSSLPEDRKMVKAKYLESATKYAKEKGITPRRCGAG